MTLTDQQRDLYGRLDRLGRVRLSRHFYLRQFLHSEIAVMSGIVNLPDNEEIAIETGTRLCERILEPLVASYGPIVVRSGFRSAELNAYGHSRNLHCAANTRNFAYHIWDHLDEGGKRGAAACIVIPAVTEAADFANAREELISFIVGELDFHRLTFFRRNGAFNIGWHEAPSRIVRR